MFEIRLEETCGACPEQYDAYLGDYKVGYLRLRHGIFTVQCGGRTVFEAYPDGDGCFTAEERNRYLELAKFTIWQWLKEQPV